MNAPALTSDHSHASWRALRHDRGLRHHLAACQAWLHRAGECNACRDACPLGALLFDADGLALHPDCVDCGRCAPACPQGALELPLTLPERPLEVDCRRVPGLLRGDAVAPCLGALEAATLARWALRDDAAPVRLLDRGWCAACGVGGGGMHPVEAALAQAWAWLAEAGVPPERWPRLATLPLPADVALPERAGGNAGEPLSRRAFFGRLSSPVRTPSPAALRPPPRAAAAHPSLARARLRDALGGLPASALPALAAGERCLGHAGCARVCPTGALRAWEEGDAGGVNFDAALCTACGLCARHCPEGALRLDATGGEAREIRLNRHARSTCAGCGDVFEAPAGEEEEDLCEPCRKSRLLAQNLFQPMSIQTGGTA